MPLTPRAHDSNRDSNHDRDDELLRTARDAFGWDELRPGQLEAMRALTAGRDAMVVMPTGAGKSAVYQVPALLLDGPTVVVSPLISLQRDQVAALADRVGRTGAPAVAANSHTRRDDALDAVAAGDAEFLFLSPEQLADPEVLARVAATSPSLVAVDEAHCVSAWGHDFRPDYLNLGVALDALGRPPTVALTATASPPVRDEIVARLGLRDPVLVATGFDRPNLHLTVRTLPESTRSAADVKTEQVVELAASLPKPGIVYAATRRATEAHAAALAELGLAVEPYHAGMKASERERVQSSFTAGEVDVVVATTAFGMGIDKADVRFVLHADVPDSLDSYYQEVGRAGRDGEPAEAVLLYREADLGLRRFFASGLPDPEKLSRAARLVAAAEAPVPPREVAQEMGIGATRLAALVNLLTDVGAVEVVDGGHLAAPDDAPRPAEAATAALERAEARQKTDRSRVEMVRGFAETRGCRRQYLLAYFGEQAPATCDACDTCDAGTAAAAEAEPVEGPYALQSRVAHAEWGPGLVMRLEGDRIVVLFEQVGYRTLLLAAVEAGGLLTPA